jgi:hypothetical protein
MKAQAASLPFTPVLAAMAAIVNTKLPQVGVSNPKPLLIRQLLTLSIIGTPSKTASDAV